MARYDLSKDYKRQSAEAYFKKLLDKNAVIDLKKIDLDKIKRSLDQNALMWLWLKCIEKETGNDKNEFHLLYRANFLAKEDSYITKIIIPSLWEKTKIRIGLFDYFKGLGDIIDIISYSTTEQDVAGILEYLNKIQDHANDSMDIILPKLEEKLFSDFYNEYAK